MGAGFNVGDKVFWGTNGAVESYLEAMSVEAAHRLGPDDPLTVFFQDEHAQFYTGKIMILDEWTDEKSRRQRLLELLDAATARILASGTFSDYGREWIATDIAELRAILLPDAPTNSAEERSADS